MGVLKVDLDALLVMANAVDGEADVVRGLTPGAAFDSAAGAMADSAFGAALARVGAPTTETFLAFSTCLRRMAETTADTAKDYDSAVEEFRRQIAAAGTSFEAGA